MKTRFTQVGVAIAAIAATVGVVSAYAAQTPAPALHVQAESAIADVSVDDANESTSGAFDFVQAEKELTANLRELEAQKASEMAQAARDYELPAGASFGSGDDFSLITDQIEAVKSQRMLRDSTGSFRPETYWYEPGSFRSDAIVQWQCAWLKQAVLSHEANDIVGRDNAVGKLLAFRDSQDISMFPDYDRFLEDNVYPLRDGETGNARNFINSGFSCIAENQLK